VNRRRLVLNVVAKLLLVTRRRLLHLPLLLLLRLSWLRLVLRMLGLVAPLVVQWHCTSVPHARVAQIMHGRVEMAQWSTSIALLLHRNRDIASMPMWLRNWRGRPSWRHCRPGPIQHLSLQICHAFHAWYSGRGKTSLPWSRGLLNELLVASLVMLLVKASLLVLRQARLGRWEVWLGRERGWLHS
jgi:hypothetical protein